MVRFFMFLLVLLFVAPLPAGPGQFELQYKPKPVPKPVPKIEYKEVKKLVWKWESLGMFEVTAYCANCRVCDTNWETADQTFADYRKRIVAADKFLSFKTKLWIEGQSHIYTVRDRGGKIKGRKLDILMSSHWRAKRFGRQKLEVWTPIVVEVVEKVPVTKQVTP